MRVKKYIWSSNAAALPDTGIENVLLGDEGCGLFMKSASLSIDIRHLRKEGKSVGLVIPCLTPERELDFAKILEGLDEKTEIVVNDMGAFCLAENAGHIPIIGRLMTKQHTDPAISGFTQKQPDRKILYDGEKALLKYAPPPKSQSERFSDIAIFSKSASEIFLKNRRSITVILDMALHGLPKEVPDGFEVMLNTGDILVSVFPCAGCGSCPKKETFIGQTRANVPLYRRGSVCYYKNPGEIDMPAYVSKLLFYPENII